MTIKDIANLAGVSISTVSKIVNNKAKNINIETKNRVLKIVKEYNYTPYGQPEHFFRQNLPHRCSSETNFPDASDAERYPADSPETRL